MIFVPPSIVLTTYDGGVLVDGPATQSRQGATDVNSGIQSENRNGTLVSSTNRCVVLFA